MPKTIDEVKQLFEEEFFNVREKFCVFTISVLKARESSEEYIWHPGVYVWWHPDGVLKVGRHFTNSRKRALEHIEDNTGGVLN